MMVGARLVRELVRGEGEVDAVEGQPAGEVVRVAQGRMRA
jgi:hypothetical protein